LEVKVELTEHFWERWDGRKEFMLREGVTPEKIIEFAGEPDLIMQDPKHPGREWRIKRVRSRCLKIVVEVKGDRLEVITAFFDRTLKRRGLCE